MDTTDLLNSTDDLIERLYTAAWKGSLRFPGCVLCKEDTHYDEKAAGDVDIFELLGDHTFLSNSLQSSDRCHRELFFERHRWKAFGE